MKNTFQNKINGTWQVTQLQEVVEATAMLIADCNNISLDGIEIRVGDATSKGTGEKAPEWALSPHGMHRRCDMVNDKGETKIVFVIPITDLLVAGSHEDKKRNLFRQVSHGLLHCLAEKFGEAVMTVGGRHNLVWVKFACKYGFVFDAGEKSESRGYDYLKDMTPDVRKIEDFVVSKTPDSAVDAIVAVAADAGLNPDGDKTPDGDGKGSGKGGKKNERKSYMVGCESGEAGHDLPTNFRKEDDAKAVIAWAGKCPKCGKALKVVTLAEVKTDEGKENAGTPEPKPEENKAPGTAGIPTLGEVVEKHGVAS